MQQTERCETTGDDRSVQEKGSLKRPRKRSSPVKHPPDAYIKRITCPTRQQFYKNLLQQELASKSSNDRKLLNACKCSSKLSQQVRSSTVTAADAHGDAPSRRVIEEDGGRPSSKRGKKIRIRRLRHRRDIPKLRVRDRSTSVEDQQVQANVDGCETYCKVARKNSALYNINESQREHLKYGLFNKGRPVRPPEQTSARSNPVQSLRREGSNRRVFQPQGQQRNMHKPHRPGEASASKKQVLKLSSSQIMHLDIKPKGMTSRRELQCPLPLRNNVIRRANRTAPHYVLFRRGSPVKPDHLNRVYRRGFQSRRYVHAPLAQTVTPVSRYLLNNRGRNGSNAPLKAPSNASPRKELLQLCHMMSPNQKRFSTLPRNTKRFIPNQNYAKTPKNQPCPKCTHQSRVEKRPEQSVKTKLRLRSSSLQHASYYAHPNERNHSMPWQPRRILSTRSIGNIGSRYTRTQDPTFIKQRPSMSGNSFIPPGVTMLRSQPPAPAGILLRDRTSSISREVSSLRNRSSTLSSGATSLRYRSSTFSRMPSSLIEKPSIYSSGAPSTSYGSTLQCNRLLSREPSPRPITQRPTPRIIPQRPPPPLKSRPSFLRVRPPVPSRAQTSINTPPPAPTKSTSLRDLLNNLKSISQRDSRQSLAREQPYTMNSTMFNRYPYISLRPFRKSATLSGCSCDVLPEKEEEETPDMENTTSTNTTEQLKLTSISTQTLIRQERRVNNTKNLRT